LGIRTDIILIWLGVGAITIVPRIAYDPLLVAFSFLIAISASFAALWRLRRQLFG
jgi:NO-binding membrane sensor protein with MHYT domain